MLRTPIYIDVDYFERQNGNGRHTHLHLLTGACLAPQRLVISGWCVCACRQQRASLCAGVCVASGHVQARFGRQSSNNALLHVLLCHVTDSRAEVSCWSSDAAFLAIGDAFVVVPGCLVPTSFTPRSGAVHFVDVAATRVMQSQVIRAGHFSSHPISPLVSRKCIRSSPAAQPLSRCCSSTQTTVHTYTASYACAV